MIKKVLLTIFTIFILIIINCNMMKSYAVESYGCTLIVESNKKTIKKGEEITLTIKASDINAGNGIVMFSTIIEFDENDFSFANQNEIVSAQGWSNFARIDNSITFYRSDYLPNSENQEIGKVKLIAKNDITAGDKAITFTSNEFVIEVSEGQENTLNIDNLGLSIKVEDENHSGNDNTTNDNTTSDDTTNDNTTSDDTTDDNTTDEDTNNNSTANDNVTDNNTTNDNATDDNNTTNDDNNTIENNTSDDNDDNVTNSGNNYIFSGNTMDGQGISLNEKNTISNKNLPKAGLTGFIGISCFILLMAAIISYIKYKRAI